MVILSLEMTKLPTHVYKTLYSNSNYSAADRDVEESRRRGRGRRKRKEEECSYDAAVEEIILLWGIQQATLSKPNAFISHSCLELELDVCGHSLSIFQSPSSLNTPGVTGAVMWDSGVVLSKFLEHASDLELRPLQGKKVVELRSGCGLVGCIAALLGRQVVFTGLPDRLRLLRKNAEVNLRHEEI
ncbi:hypothetical protein ACFX1X_016278 [Malus domestica]